MSSKTAVVYFFPIWTLCWGILMCATGSFVYDSAPILYKGFSGAPQWAWGIPAIIIGAINVVSMKLCRKKWVLATAWAHCALLMVMTLLFISHSILGGMLYVLLTFFKAVHMAELFASVHKD